MSKSGINSLESSNEALIGDFLKGKIREKLLKDVEVRDLSVWWVKNVFYKEVERVGFNRRMRLCAKSLVTLGLIAEVDLSELQQVGEILKKSEYVGEMVDRLILDVVGLPENYVENDLAEKFSEEIDKITFMFSMEVQLAITFGKFSADELKNFLYRLKEVFELS